MNNYEKLLYKVNRQKRQLRGQLKIINNYKQENQQLKSVLNEVKEVIIELRNIIYNPDYKYFGFSKEQYRDRFAHLFELLDKVGDK